MYRRRAGCYNYGMRIIIRPNLLNTFRQRALRKYPQEYGELLYGLPPGESSSGKFEIFELVVPSAVAGPGHWYTNGETIAPRRGLFRLLGDVHSHPKLPDDKADASPSLADWERAAEAGYDVQGICCVDPGGPVKTQVRFYTGRGLFKTMLGAADHARFKQFRRTYATSAKGHAANKRYNASAKGHAAQRRYETTAKVRLARHNFNVGKGGKAASLRYAASDKARARAQRYLKKPDVISYRNARDRSMYKEDKLRCKR